MIDFSFISILFTIGLLLAFVGLLLQLPGWVLILLALITTIGVLLEK